MPRGVPKKDDTGMRYTLYHIPPAITQKHITTTYLKNESQTIWHRNAARKNKTTADDAAASQETKGRRGSQVIVIHLGSRFLRVGKACDVNPVTIPSVVAWRCKGPVVSPVFVEGVSRPKKGRIMSTKGGDASAVHDDPFEEKVATLIASLRDRMRFYKHRVTPNATSIARTFNEQFKPEIIPEHNDPYRVEWLDASCNEAVLIGEKALRLAEPERSGYLVRWPIYGHNFNTRDYKSTQENLSDIDILIRKTLQENMNIEPSEYKNYSVVLVIPDLYQRAYVKELVNLLLTTMGFKQLCAQQESLAATYGAGISNACVVDLGAKVTSIACVDEGMVISDSRLTLNIGGDDITEFLYVMLQRIGFPYRDINLARSYDWKVMEDLKTRLCTLTETDIALNLYDFVVRRPDRPTEKYGLRAYDEIILAPMCLFESRVIEFDRKRIGLHVTACPDVTDEIIEHAGDHVTQAMIISTQHLLSTNDDAVAKKPEPVNGDGDTAEGDQQNTSKNNTPMKAELPSSSQPDMIDIDDDKPATAQHITPRPSQAQSPVTPPPSGFSIDVPFEASKLPLDVAIFNSARATGGDEKIRKYLQAVLMVGGTGLTQGIIHALESRLQAIATPLVPNMEKVQIIPPPKEVDRRVLVWKGAAVLGKMDGVSELWITPSDWDILGMRGLKERCFYL
ncbi:hypothetical protein M378DRAFT_69891 [Amanita muscaria Koide BX008]|uniref:Uncharacterized protein n=1 Tax=Amanita muscaria (strain Koide BX008) TaxID=946122 RepID=A0A0C2T0J2_AMAMK|nr:hypothetical protein M378DRAFT_69891 [Amanita muscaria Koide BX008]